MKKARKKKILEISEIFFPKISDSHREPMKVLEICEFSAGICGVWTRVKQEALLLAKKGYKVIIFSSDIVKGTEEKASSEEKIGEIKIYRFKTKNSILSKNVTYFDFEKELIKLIKNKEVDLVVTHLIHPHSFKALKLCLKENIPCYLVTHAPFNVKRKFLLNLMASFYYKFRVKPNIKKFTKIISITKWEKPYLLKLGIEEKNILCIPNGIPHEFFKEKIKKFNAKKILFIGRIAPVKNLETLISAFKKINKNLKLEIIGPIEKGYEKIKKFESENIRFLPVINNLNKKIKKMQEADIFVLPSKREAMPQALIEAMALGKIVLASDTLGVRDIIKDCKNGFLFKTQDVNDLKNKLENVIKMKQKEIIKIQKNVRNSVKKFNWSSIINKIENLIK